MSFCRPCKPVGAQWIRRLILFVAGEMGIGNTTPAAAIAAALYGGGAQAWVGRGSGVDDAGFALKRSVVDAGLARHEAILGILWLYLQALRRA